MTFGSFENGPASGTFGRSRGVNSLEGILTASVDFDGNPVSPHFTAWERSSVDHWSDNATRAPQVLRRSPRFFRWPRSLAFAALRLCVDGLFPQCDSGASAFFSFWSIASNSLTASVMPRCVAKSSTGRTARSHSAGRLWPQPMMTASVAAVSPERFEIFFHLGDDPVYFFAKFDILLQ